ncbi:uncharacterized protein LOC121280022 [Carcharodon carcharias]|uniref:uncharacterized protein LOC121280022 n=1 Tax=Carcharodon carcharias TaxID=13397 RepID=UPI001B7DD14D|nr:uncharacterized protein LOC121280022 [Carcharodon carcharias]
MILWAREKDSERGNGKLEPGERGRRERRIQVSETGGREGVKLREEGAVYGGEGAGSGEDLCLWRRRRRQMVQTHLLRMASKTFGSPKCRLRVITAVPAPDQPQLRAWPRLQLAGVVEELGVTGQGEAGWGVTDYTEWLSVRKRQRAELEMMADVKRWINTSWRLESRERRDRARDKIPTQQAQPERYTSQQQQASNQLINLPSLESEKLLHEDLNKKQLRFVDSFQSSDKGKKGKLSKYDLMLFEKSKMHHMDLIEECLLLSGEERSMACHSLPTTMGGEMGEATNTYRQRCLTDYKKILEMCQYYGITFTEGMLEKDDVRI